MKAPGRKTRASHWDSQIRTAFISRDLKTDITGNFGVPNCSFKTVKCFRRKNSFCLLHCHLLPNQNLVWPLPFLKVFLRHFHLTDKQANTFIYVTHRMLPACIASKRVPLLARLFTSTRSSSASILDVCQNKQQKGCPKVEVWKIHSQSGEVFMSTALERN